MPSRAVSTLDFGEIQLFSESQWWTRSYFDRNVGVGVDISGFIIRHPVLFNELPYMLCYTRIAVL